MKKVKTYIITLLITTLMITFPATSVSAERQVEGYGWGNTFQTDSNAWATSVAVDSSNNSYVIGNYSGTTDFDPGVGTDSVACPDSYCMFVVKINADDTYGWARVMPNDNYIEPRDVVVSGANIYIVGEFYGTTDFDPSVGTDSISTVSASGSDMFFTSLTAASGVYVDTQTMGGPDSLSSIQPQAMDIDSSGDIYIVGHFFLTVDFNGAGGTDNKTSLGSSDIFLTKINSDLTYGYTYTIGGGHSSNADYGWGVAVDSSDNVYIAGQFQGTADINPTGGTDSKVSAGAADGVVIKLNANATYGYGYTFGSTGTDYATAIGVDSADNVYYASRIANGTTVDVDPTGGTQNVVVPGSGQTIALTRLDSDATFGWANSWPIGQSSSIEIDSGDTIYLSGGFSGSVDFDPSGGTDTIAAAGSSDTYVLKMASDGTYVGASSIGGAGASVYSYKAAIDGNDSYYVVGDYYDAAVDFDPGAGTDSVAPTGFGDAFAVKLTTEAYQHIDSLTGLSAINLDNAESVDDETTDDGVPRGDTVTTRVLADGLPLADASVDYSSDRDWSSVVGETDAVEGRAYIHNLRAAPGVTADYTLYVPYLDGSDQLGFCPGADSFDDLTESCTDFSIKTEADGDTSLVDIDGNIYWAVTGVTGSGGFTITAASEQPEPSSEDTDTGTNEDSTESLAETGMNNALLAFVSVLMIIGSVLVYQKRRKSLEV